MMAGGPSFASFTFGTISFSVPVTTLWSVRVPHWMSATGVSALLPWVTRLSTMFWRFFMPMKKTSVPMPVASSFQCSLDSGFVGSSWPVTKATLAV